MFKRFRALFAQKNVDTSKGIWLGLRKNLTRNAEDANGKKYTRFRLITEGEHKGAYVHVPHINFTRIQFRDKTAETEMLDIIKSGLEICILDPKSDPKSSR